MRTIKFRCWDLKTEKMKYIHSLEFTFDRSVVNAEISDKYGTGTIEYRKDGDDLVLQQFTGLLDKNGKEIYEGDIDEESMGYVGFCKKCIGYQMFFRDPDSNDEICHNCNGDFDTREGNLIIIIGNIYQNPELI